MLTGDEIRLRRQMASMTQADLARIVGVSVRSIGNYERGETVPRNKLPLIEEALAHPMASDLHEQPSSPALGQATDAQLLAEIARRFARGQESDGTATNQAGASPAPTQLHADLIFPKDPPIEIVDDDQVLPSAALKGPPSQGRSLRRAQDEQGEAPDVEGPEGGA